MSLGTPCFLLTLQWYIISIASFENKLVLKPLITSPLFYGDNSSYLEKQLPKDWPHEWTHQKIPYVIDFYAPSIKRLILWIREGISFLEERSCLLFEEKNPKEVARKANYTYIFYTFSGVDEDCCLPYYTKSVGRRLALVTPKCVMPPQIAHITLHALGLYHPKNEPFVDDIVTATLFQHKCDNFKKHYSRFFKHWTTLSNNLSPANRTAFTIKEMQQLISGDIYKVE